MHPQTHYRSGRHVHHHVLDWRSLRGQFDLMTSSPGHDLMTEAEDKTVTSSSGIVVMKSIPSLKNSKNSLDRSAEAGG